MKLRNKKTGEILEEARSSMVYNIVDVANKCNQLVSQLPKE